MLRPGVFVSAAIVTGLAHPVAAGVPSEEAPPSCLDQSIRGELGSTIRPRGVQERTFLKKGQIVLTGHGGLLGSDLLSTTYLYGGAVGFFLTEDFAIEVSADITRAELDIDKPLANFFGDDRFKAGRAYLGMASFVWSPIHAKMKAGDGIVLADVLLTAGAGRLFHESAQGIGFNIGAAVEILTTDWVTVRIDIRDLILVQEVVAETRLTNNLMVLGGLSLWLPTWHGH